MRARLAASSGLLVLGVALGLPQGWAVAGQRWTAPQSPDGHPDLQGIWVNNSATPLERPEALRDRPSLTDAEVAALQARAARFVADGRANDFAPGDNFFLAVWANRDAYKSPTATGGADDSVDKVFENRTSLIVDPPDGRIPWTPEGSERWEVQRRAGLAASPDGPESLPNFIRCITYGVPRVGGNSTDYSNYYQVIQTKDAIVLYGEAIHDARIIPIDGRPHLPASVRRWNGDSVGRWEGDALVVDTTNFSPKSRFMGAADRLHLTERLTRVGPETIDYEITLEDPTTWTKPWTAVIHLRHSDDKMYEFACHEGSFDVIRDVLAGARFEEKAAEAGGRKPPR